MSMGQSPQVKPLTRETVIALARQMFGSASGEDILDRPLGEHGQEMLDAIMFGFCSIVAFAAPNGLDKLTVRETLRQLGL